MGVEESWSSLPSGQFELASQQPRDSRAGLDYDYGSVTWGQTFFSSRRGPRRARILP